MTDVEEQILTNQVAIMALLTNMIGDNASGTRDDILLSVLECAEATHRLTEDKSGYYPHLRC